MAPVSLGNLTEQEQSICRALEKRARSMLTDLERHVNIPTGKGHTPGLDEYRGVLLDRIRAIGAKVSIREGQDRPDWLIGAGGAAPPPSAVCSHPDKSGARVMIACHLDTVFDPKASFNRFVLSQDEQTATGPGVVDMKGGVLVALNALEALVEAGVPLHWTLVLTSDEETGSYCSEQILREVAREHDIGIATEPALPGGELAIERMGSGQFQIETFGRSAHVGRDFTSGISAVTAMARTLVAVSEIPEPERGMIASVGPVHGGDAANAVPEHAVAWGNVRFPDREIADELQRRLEALASDGDSLPRVVIRHSLNRPAKPLMPGTLKLAEMARAVAESLGQALPFAKTGGVCDGNILQDEGLPTIDTLGVRGGGLHTTKEWIEVASQVERAQLMAVLLARLAEQGFDRGAEA